MVELSDDRKEFFVHVPSLQPSSYAIGYTFKAPFPTPSGILGKMVSEDDDEDEADENPEKGAYEDAFETQLALNASISGEVEHLVQEAQLRYEDGWEDKAEVSSILWIIMPEFMLI